MVSSAGAYRCVALDHVGFVLTAPPSLIEQGRKKYSRLLRAFAEQQAVRSHPSTTIQTS